MANHLPRYGFLIGLLLTTIFGMCQEAIPAVKLQARATSRSIKLRWAPNSPSAWQLGNKYGYTIDRVPITENGKLIKNREYRILNAIPIRPAAPGIWEKLIDTDDYVAAAAQAIYGETFEVTHAATSEMLKMVTQARELELRFSFTLFSADQSIKAAELSGLSFEDETVAPGTKYVYRVYTNIPQSILKVDTAFVFVGLQDFQPLPPVTDIQAEFEDHIAQVSWNGSLLEKTYNSFWLERSADGAKTFIRTTKQPIVNSFNGEAPKSMLIFKSDSLPLNDTRYYYRVRGINAFGEVGPPSDTVSGVGRSTFAYSSSITRHEILSNGGISLEWTFPVNGVPILKSFDLVRIDQKTKKIELIKSEIGKSLRVIVDEKPRGTNYYAIRAVDKYGRTNNSFPYLVQLEDSIPPSPPTKLEGRIDTLGHVYLRWKENSERDLAGYSVFRANFISDEFIQLPGDVRTSTSYTDTIRLDNLSEKIYYKVIALDNHFNASSFSELLELEKPDIVPPVPPVFEKIRNDTLGIVLNWINSSSQDVIEHVIYRRSTDESDWTLLKRISLRDTAASFIDTLVQHQMRYEYTMIAIDDDGLESLPCDPASVTFIDYDPYPEVDQIFYSLDERQENVSVTWRCDRNDVDKFLIYRSINTAPLRLIRTADAVSLTITDRFAEDTLTVQYRISAQLKNGERTRISKPITIRR